MERISTVSYNGQIPDSLVIPPGKLLLAFSGGSDSLFLALMLSMFAPGRVEAVYVDHGLRDRNELEREVALNRSNAAALSIPLSVETVAPGQIMKIAENENIGVEAAARKERYRILFQKAEDGGFNYILTAHHREDQVETVLMRMLGNAPFWSYQGIVRDEGRLCRPLLDVPKATIMQILQASGLRWSEDSTNEDTNFLRNSIRHKIMPLLSETERCCISHIAANVASLRRRYPSLSFSRDGGYVQIDRSVYLDALPFQREEFIYSAMQNGGYAGRVSRRLVEAVTENAALGKGHIESCGFYFYFSASSLSLYPPLYDFAVFWDGRNISVHNLVLEETVPDNLTLVVDRSKLVPPVIFRNAREGDRIELKDGWKNVSELEKDQRVPYSLVLEDRKGIVAYFSRFLGGRDRLSKRFLGAVADGVALAIRWE